ncbi:hypothetical protein B7759_00001 [Burkholderia glumae]|nr:hypothetical protein B7759_00001 [Burkholderia glumae]
MRGFTASFPCAASSAFMPVYLPSGVTVPMTFVVVSASSFPSATRTTTVMGFVCLPIASSVRRSVPFVPALLSAATTFVSSTGVSSGNAAGSASAPVQTMPSTAVETCESAGRLR